MTSKASQLAQVTPGGSFPMTQGQQPIDIERAIEHQVLPDVCNHLKPGVTLTVFVGHRLLKWKLHGLK